MKANRNKPGQLLLETPFRISLIITIILIAIDLAFYQKITPEIPLFYSLADSSSHLAQKNWIFLLPILSLLINLAHFSLSKVFKQIDSFVLRLFIWATLIFQIILFMISIRIIAVIG